MVKDARKKGADVNQMLRSWTNDGKKKRISEIVNGLTEEEVVPFVLGFYHDGDGIGNEGLIELLDDDCCGLVSMQKKKWLLNVIVKKAREKKCPNKANELKGLLDRFENEGYKGKTFNCGYSNWDSFFKWTGLAVHYNEKIDDVLQRLVNDADFKA